MYTNTYFCYLKDRTLLINLAYQLLCPVTIYHVNNILLSGPKLDKSNKNNKAVALYLKRWVKIYNIKNKKSYPWVKKIK